LNAAGVFCSKNAFDPGAQVWIFFAPQVLQGPAGQAVADLARAQVERTLSAASLALERG
jgi:hypothetical protein